MEEAEIIAMEEHGSWKIAVISGVGTRNYYRLVGDSVFKILKFEFFSKLGYELDGPYMSKVLRPKESN